MMRHHRLLLLTLLPALVAAATACSGPDPERVVARVEGKDITLQKFAEFYRPPRSFRGDEEALHDTLQVRLDELIGYTLIQEAGRADGLHRTPDFRKRLQDYEKTLLNRLLKQRQIVEKMEISEAQMNDFLAHSTTIRHVLHIITLAEGTASQVATELREGEPWDAVAKRWSRDGQVGVHGGDLGWVRWGQGHFTYYPDLQEKIFSIPVGEWEGPIQTSGEYHFIKITEEEAVDLGSEEEAFSYARSRLVDLEQRRMEQEMADRMWQRGEYRLDEDHFRWLVDQITASFDSDPGLNPIPELSREDRARVVIRSPSDPYTAGDLLNRLALLNPAARDNALQMGDWRQQFIEWVLTDEAAREARGLGYQNDPGFLREREAYIDGRLYALKREAIREARGVPADDDLETYYRGHPEEFDLPEFRRIIEVLLASKEEAEEIRRRALAGEDLGDLASQYTIRDGYRRRRGRFAPIRAGEFGALGEAVFSTSGGEIGPIVETPLGYSVFLVEGIAAPRVIQLDDVRRDLRERLRMDWVRENEGNFRREARARATIWLNEELLDRYAQSVYFSVQQRAAADSAAAAADRPPSR